MSIKSIGIDLFINFHPKIKQLKRESKELHKKNKHNGLSLMQCQELVAKNHGFLNWHHLTQLIKKYYQEELDNIPFIITNKKEAPKEDDKRYSNSPILMGKDVNFNHYLWQSESSLRTHHLLLGENIYNTYDLYLIKQSLHSNIPFIFLNGDGDVESLDYILAEASKANTLNSVRIINFTKNPISQQHEYKLLDNFTQSSISLIEIFSNLIIFDSNTNENYKNKAISILSLAMLYLVYKRDIELCILDLEAIYNFFSFDKFYDTSKVESLPQYIKDSFKRYITSLEVADESSLIENNLIIENISHMIKKIMNSQMFSGNGISIETILTSDFSYIFHFAKETQEEHLIIINMIKSLFFKIGEMSIVSNNFPLDTENNKRKIKALFIRNCYLTRGVSVIPSQARALGISITFSYSSLNHLTKFSNTEEAQSILANTNTKIFSIQEKDEETLRLLNTYKQITNNNDILKSQSNDASVNIHITQEKSSNIWIIKRNHVAQLSFEN